MGEPEGRRIRRSGERRSGTRGPFALIALMVMWLALPILLIGRFAQDAVPFLVAGGLSASDPHEVYSAIGGDLFTLGEEFSRRSCELSPTGTDCTNLNVAFVSPPIALPLAWGLASLGPVGGVLAVRFVAALMLTGGYWILAQRLRARAPDMDAPLTVTAFLLTPFVIVPLALGQTSPVLFLSAALGVRITERSHKAAAGVALVWVLASVLKVWPAALLLLLLWQRRWRVIGWAIGWTTMFVAFSLPFSPLGVTGDFLRMSRALNATAVVNPYSGSLGALAYHLWEPLSRGGAAAALLVVRMALVGWAAWWGMRKADRDLQWAFGYLVLLAFVPLVWWHYLWVALAALAIALATRPKLGSERILLPIVAFVTVPISLLSANGRSWPIGQSVFLLAMLVLVAWLGRGEPIDLHGPAQPRIGPEGHVRS